MTKGGLLTTRSNRSAAAGSNRSPCRSSARTPFSARLSRAKARARRGDVGRDGGSGVPARVQSLDAAARADVEDATDGRPERAPGQHDRGSADPEDVFGAERASRRELPQVGGDPPGGAAG